MSVVPSVSSINPYFTMSYEQPKDYRFSHDSVFLARRAFEWLLQNEKASQIASWKVLDLCAGCGIIGLDFFFHCAKEINSVPPQMDFLEIQEVYRPFFEVNKNNLLQRLQKDNLLSKPAEDLNAKISVPILNFQNQNFCHLLSHQEHSTYDLILSNPPYFQPAHGKLSPSIFKNRCRFFLDGTFHDYLEAVLRALKPGGQAHLLLRDNPDHRWNILSEAHKILPPHWELRVLGDIRGTHWALLQKKN